MSTLAKVGFVELAAGGLTGWLIVLSREQPDLLKRAGVRVPRRLLQMHLDLILMGLILVAAGLALPDLPSWIAIPLAIGTWVNPLMFLPLAFWPEIDKRLPYRAVATVSFVFVSGGLVAVAVEALNT
jgi:hydroxylaminobenzene mutase